jgi:hypothetical protein
MEEDSTPKYIPFKERGELWQDIEPIPQFTDKVEILKISYSDRLREINDYFRAILQKNEISIRAYDLTTELIMVRFIKNILKYFLGLSYQLYGLVS